MIISMMLMNAYTTSTIHKVDRSTVKGTRKKIEIENKKDWTFPTLWASGISLSEVLSNNLISTRIVTLFFVKVVSIWLNQLKRVWAIHLLSNFRDKSPKSLIQCAKCSASFITHKLMSIQLNKNVNIFITFSLPMPALFEGVCLFSAYI